MPQMVSVEFMQAEFDRAMAEFARNLMPKATDTVVRKAAFDIAAETMIGLNGVDGLPKRIDTGRLRGGWRVALNAAGIKGFTRKGGGTAKSNSNEAGDGSGSVTTTGLRTQAVVSNNVRYARFVEDGTIYMRGGHHLKRALMVVRRNLPTDKSPGSVQSEVRSAFHGERATKIARQVAAAAKGGGYSRAATRALGEVETAITEPVT